MEQTGGNMELLQQILKTEKKQYGIAKARFVLSLLGFVLAVAALGGCVLGALYMKGQIETVMATIDVLSGEVQTVADNIKGTAANVDEMVDTVKKVDLPGLESSFKALADTGTKTFSDLQSNLDGLKDVVEKAEDAMDNLRNVDISTLNDGIRRLNEVLVPLSSFFGYFGSN